MAITLPSPLVSAQWLADHLGADDLVVVDASVVSFTQPNGKPGSLSGHEQYIAEGHIPGAVFADLIEEFSDQDGRYPFTRPTAERFAAAAGALGIGAHTTVVVYDTVLGQWAARFWWLLRAFGHDAAAVLDGGLTAWRADDRPVERGHVSPTPRPFVGVERPDVWVDKAYVERVVRGEEEAALVCSIPPKEFTGEVASRARPGVIPGSRSLPAVRLVDRESRTALPDAELHGLFAPILEAPRIITYCNGGIAAAAAALQLVRLGETHVAIYDGSLNEWAADPDAPLVTAASGALV
ncbi:sulfurtransferase [Pseudolysinimonas yzui]|uniref:Thiosulfate sulfurtransferase n=1 Tax=Pseudolysinimonas yzui TaxID=2708254 RepID=A0A8J3M208_9MICO|nr:rhodanese-like domain-containing protein [Pseudolysinimonas yzui]GHF23305.1 thiosulfate sulfurtransferase [Pseudolysinimonas yzui]